MEITSGTPEINVGGGYGNGFGGDAGIMFLAFLAMMGGFGGNFGGRGVPNNVATTDTVNQAVQYSSLVDQNRDITAQIGNTQANMMQYTGDKYSELKDDIAATAVTLANMQAHQNECCCQIKQEIAALNLANEQRFAALNSKLDQDTIQRLRDQVNDLRDDLRMQGVVRYPAGYTFNAGPGPFSGAPLPGPGFNYGV